MKVELDYNNFKSIVDEYCTENLTEEEIGIIYDYFTEITTFEPVRLISVKEALMFYMDELVFLFGEFETWEEYEESKNVVSD